MTGAEQTVPDVEQAMTRVQQSMRDVERTDTFAEQWTTPQESGGA